MSKSGYRLAWRGFTLVELMVVVTLIVAMLMILIPVLRGFHQGRLERAANTQLVADLNSARLKAINSASPVYIVFMPRVTEWSKMLMGGGVDTGPVEQHLGSSQSANNRLAGQLTSYAFYTEGAVGDQPTHSRSTRRVDNKKYVSEWKRLPEGTMFTDDLLAKLRLMNNWMEVEAGGGQVFTMDASGNRWPAPRPRGLDNEFPGNLGLQMPYIGYGPNGQVIGVHSGQMFWDNAHPAGVAMTLADGFFSMKIATGSVFPPEVEPATGFYKVVDVDAKEEVKGESKYNQIRINMLTGRSGSNVCDVYWDRANSQVPQGEMLASVQTVLSEMIADHGLSQGHFLDFSSSRPLLLKEVNMDHARLFESLLLDSLQTTVNIEEKQLRMELLFD